MQHRCLASFKLAIRKLKLPQIANNEECKYSAAFNDPEVMAQTMANPAKMMELFALMGNPQTAQMVMNCSTDPKTWTAWTTNYSNPTKLMNAFAAFMNPQLYMNWMTASMNPQTYQPVFGFMNPGIYMQWMTAAANPAFYQPMYKMADPKMAARKALHG